MKINSSTIIVALLLGVSLPIFCSSKINKNFEEDIPLTEDLMREHGALNRLLLIFQYCNRKIEQGELPNNVLLKAISIIQKFIQNYHEKLEEDYVFPLFEKQHKQLNLVKTLRKQHNKGRAIMRELQEILHSNKTDKNTQKRVKLLLKKFIRMYRPHEAREDTVLFPQVRSLISEKEFKELGEIFEKMERKLFGKDGFFSVVNEIAELEKELGIYNLDQFTP